MTEIKLHAMAVELDASESERTITGKITVFGTVAESHGLKLDAGCLVPREPLKRVKMLRDHDHSQPVGYMTEFSQGDSEATATFYIPSGPDGDRALSEAKSGLRDGLSVGFMPTDYEFDEEFNLVIHTAELYEVSLCAIPAFQDAQVESVAAAVAASLPKMKEEKMPEKDNSTAATEAAASTGQATSTANDQAAGAPAATTTAQPAGPALRTGPESLASRPGKQLTARQQLMSDIASKRNVALALDPIIQSDVFDPTTVPAFVGEMWKGRGYQQRYAPLISQETLTAQEMVGWRWTTTPDVKDYAGDLTAVGTNPVQAESVPFSAKRVASGHKVDRIHVDMPNPAFWDSFYRERATNYAKLMDTKVINHLTTAANHTAQTVPNGTTDPWAKLYTGAQWCLEFAVPTFAIVGADLYQQLALTADSDKLAFLNASLGLEEGSLAGFKIVGAPISNTALDGTVIVGASAATSLYQLPGGPIRVDALDVANGGVDAGLFGYYALFTNDARGVISVTEAAV